jgi:hypothetical protein
MLLGFAILAAVLLMAASAVPAREDVRGSSLNGRRLPPEISA